MSLFKYDDHITPNVDGTDPLGALGHDPFATLAETLVRQLAGGSGGLTTLIPVVRCEPCEVRSTTRSRGLRAGQRRRVQPTLRHALLGNKALMVGAAVPAAKMPSARRHDAA